MARNRWTPKTCNRIKCGDAVLKYLNCIACAEVAKTFHKFGGCHDLSLTARRKVIAVPLDHLEQPTIMEKEDAITPVDFAVVACEFRNRPADGRNTRLCRRTPRTEQASPDGLLGDDLQLDESTFVLADKS